ncbi:bZIP transcription factor 27-like [Apium graveolens]|uniref:bZIP transcription factor 27-like n=1 Tax=Apium graveolens TaxID=4045 RepID=UPI003D7B54F6
MEEIWKDIPNLSSLKNPNTSFDAMNLQEFLARPFKYPNYNPVVPQTTAEPTNLFSAGHATNNVVLSRPQGNSFSSYTMTCSAPKQQCLGLGMQSSGSARERIAISPSDRHHQRLIKNRESAARSRDRKEAHTADLETKLKTLKAENARLKMDQEFWEAAQAKKHTHTLNRSSSSPF